MGREFQRSRRVEEQIQRLLAEALRLHVRDPRVGDVVITAVQVSRDLAVARVAYVPLSGAAPAQDLQAGLERAAGFLRSYLARELNTRTVPELRFHYDELSEQARRLDALIDQARREDESAREPEGPDPASDDDRATH